MKEQQMNWQKSNALMWRGPMLKESILVSLYPQPFYKMCWYCAAPRPPPSFTVPASPEGPLVASTAEEDGAERGAHYKGHLLEPVKPGI